MCVFAALLLLQVSQNVFEKSSVTSRLSDPTSILFFPPLNRVQEKYNITIK